MWYVLLVDDKYSLGAKVMAKEGDEKVSTFLGLLLG